MTQMCCEISAFFDNKTRIHVFSTAEHVQIEYLIVSLNRIVASDVWVKSDLKGTLDFCEYLNTVFDTQGCSVVGIYF